MSIHEQLMIIFPILNDEQMVATGWGLKTGPVKYGVYPLPETNSLPLKKPSGNPEIPAFETISFRGFRC